MICPNPKCERIVSPFDEKCGHCGTPLINYPARDYLYEAEDTVQKAQSEADEMKRQMKGGFKETSRAIGLGYDKSDTVSTGEGFKSESNPEPASPLAYQQISKWQEEHLNELLGTIFSNPEILDNREYEDKVTKTDLLFDWKNSVVNGGANHYKEPDEIRNKHYYVCINGGYVHFAYAMAGTYLDRVGFLYDQDRLVDVIRRYKKNGGSFSLDDLIEVAPSDKEITTLGSSAGMAIFQCIAHELGHICFGHVWSPGYDFRTSGSNIEMEHTADGFSRMVMDRSVFREQLWKGHIQFQIANAAMSYFQGQRAGELFTPLTHPARIDRLKAVFGQTFQDLSQKYGIDEKWAEETIRMIASVLEK